MSRLNDYVELTITIKFQQGNILIERIQPTNLDKVMIVPIQVAKNSHKALMANYFGSVVYQSSTEAILFARTISKRRKVAISAS